MNLQLYIDQGISYNAYLAQIEKQHLDILAAEDPNSMAQYYSLNIKRMERLNKTFQLNDEQINRLKSMESKSFTLLTLSEGWCGDAAQILPVVHKMANTLNINEKIVFKDDHLELMQSYLTEGSSSIPIIIGVSEEGKELFRFGPRPKHGMDLLQKSKENPETYSKEEFYADLQKWYNQDKGESIFNELIALIDEIK